MTRAAASLEKALEYLATGVSEEKAGDLEGAKLNITVLFADAPPPLRAGSFRA